jgi:hypothetical protein
MYLHEELQTKWQPILEHGDLPEIKDSHRRAVTVVRCLILLLMIFAVYSL